MEPTPQERQLREQIVGFLNRHLQAVAAMAGIPIDEEEGWSIRHISWTGEEWPGLEGRPGLCFVEIFVMQGAPHEYLLILDTRACTCSFAATYRRELKHMQLIRAWASHAYAPLPDRVPWRLRPTISPSEEVPPGLDRRTLEALIRRDIKRIAKQSAHVGVDDHHWDVTLISWTGEEWPGLRPIPGCCYVEAFEHANPPHDFLYLVSILTGTPEFVACYEGDIGTFDLTIYRTGIDDLGLPDQVERRGE